ncbi:MAG: ECF transporter S component [Oscillospiraceae bacterium]
MNKKINIATIAKIGILSAIAVIVMLFEIPLWFAPPFYKIDLSEVVVLIGGFALGPVAAIFIELVKILLNLLINGTSTAGIGEAANFVIGIAFVLPAVYIYRHKKSMKTAIIGMTVGTVVMAIVGGLANLYVLLPVYANVYGMPIEALVDMGSKLNTSITDVYTFVLLATTPFNLLKGVLTSVITLLLYKKLSPILHK